MAIKTVKTSNKRRKLSETNIVQDPEVSSSSKIGNSNDWGQDFSFLDKPEPFSQSYRSKLGAKYRSDDRWYNNQVTIFSFFLYLYVDYDILCKE